AYRTAAAHLPTTRLRRCRIWHQADVPLWLPRRLWACPSAGLDESDATEARPSKHACQSLHADEAMDIPIRHERRHQSSNPCANTRSPPTSIAPISQRARPLPSPSTGRGKLRASCHRQPDRKLGGPLSTARLAGSGACVGTDPSLSAKGANSDSTLPMRWVSPLRQPPVSAPRWYWLFARTNPGVGLQGDSALPKACRVPLVKSMCFSRSI